MTEALVAADKDDELNDDAGSKLAAHIARTEKLALETAFKEALKRVRKEPGTWQNGKKRAVYVLSRVREKLPRRLQNKVLKSIEMLVAKGTSAQLGDPAVLIPQEIRTLLDYMARPSAPSP